MTRPIIISVDGVEKTVNLSALSPQDRDLVAFEINPGESYTLKDLEDLGILPLLVNCVIDMTPITTEEPKMEQQAPTQTQTKPAKCGIRLPMGASHLFLSADKVERKQDRDLMPKEGIIDMSLEDFTAKATKELVGKVLLRMQEYLQSQINNQAQGIAGHMPEPQEPRQANRKEKVFYPKGTRADAVDFLISSIQKGRIEWGKEMFKAKGQLIADMLQCGITNDYTFASWLKVNGSFIEIGLKCSVYMKDKEKGKKYIQRWKDSINNEGRMEYSRNISDCLKIRIKK